MPFSRARLFGRWVGYIKEYDGGTLMECYMHPAVNYRRVSQVRLMFFFCRISICLDIMQSMSIADGGVPATLYLRASKRTLSFSCYLYWDSYVKLWSQKNYASP